MRIFSRRDIQSALDAVSLLLTTKHVEELVGKLNGVRPGNGTSAGGGRNKRTDVVVAEWEIAILGALGRCGRIQYEKDLGGTRRPDVFFQLDGSGHFEFVADIRALSDVDAHRANPCAEFHAAICQRLLKLGHPSTGIDVRIASTDEGGYRDRKVRLALPEKKDLDRFVKEELGSFLSEIANNSTRAADFSFDRAGIKFSIHYNAKERRYCSVTHLSYTVPYSLCRNPVANALKRKADQLKESGFQGMKGIILCDAGCDTLRDGPQGAVFGCKEIVEAFFRTHSSIGWVLVIRVEASLRPLRPLSISLKSKLYPNPAAEKSLLSKTSEVIEKMIAYLPRPEATPMNARQRANLSRRHFCLPKQLGHIARPGRDPSG
jgi:hypothetical protein